jgi:hypothetical protein
MRKSMDLDNATHEQLREVNRRLIIALVASSIFGGIPVVGMLLMDKGTILNAITAFVVITGLFFVWFAHGILKNTFPARQDTRKRRRLTREERYEVWQRDGGRCVNCGTTFDLTYDHVIPFSKGGECSVSNMQLLCSLCNQKKGNRYVG